MRLSRLVCFNFDFKIAVFLKYNTESFGFWTSGGHKHYFSQCPQRPKMDFLTWNCIGISSTTWIGRGHIPGALAGSTHPGTAAKSDCRRYDPCQPGTYIHTELLGLWLMCLCFLAACCREENWQNSPSTQKDNWKELTKLGREEGEGPGGVPPDPPGHLPWCGSQSSGPLLAFPLLCKFPLGSQLWGETDWTLALRLERRRAESGRAGHVCGWVCVDQTGHLFSSTTRHFVLQKHLLIFKVDFPPNGWGWTGKKWNLV